MLIVIYSSSECWRAVEHDDYLNTTANTEMIKFKKVNLQEIRKKYSIIYIMNKRFRSLYASPKTLEHEK